VLARARARARHFLTIVIITDDIALANTTPTNNSASYPSIEQSVAIDDVVLFSIDLVFDDYCSFSYMRLNVSSFVVDLDRFVCFLAINVIRSRCCSLAD